MTSQPVLVVWEHGGNLGHLTRLLPILQALEARGHSIVFAVARPQAVAALPPNTGMKIIQAPQAAMPMAFESSAICPADIWLRCGFASPPHAKACVTQWLALFEGLNPVAVLVDASPMALYAAKVAGISALALGHGFELPPAQAGLSFAPWQNDTAEGIAHSEQVLESALISLAGSWRPDSILRHATSVSALLSLTSRAVCTWPELDHFERDLEAADFLGPIWHGLPGAQLLPWPDKPGAKVLCYIDVADKRYDLLWQAIKQHSANVLVLSPSGNDRACQAARGWGITVCQQPVQLDTLLPQCDAVIGHGGMGLTSMALHAGKPVMLLPTQLEQGLLAYRLVQRGLAVSTTSCVNKLQIQSRVAQLFQDTALHESAKRLSVRYAEFSPQRAVDLVLDRLLGASPQSHP